MMGTALIQRNDAFQLVLCDVIRQYLFPKVKFVKKSPDLMFSNSKKLVCGLILEKMNLSGLLTEEKATLWTNNIDMIARFIQFHRNNVIKRIKLWAKRKKLSLLHRKKLSHTSIIYRKN